MLIIVFAPETGLDPIEYVTLRLETTSKIRVQINEAKGDTETFFTFGVHSFSFKKPTRGHDWDVNVFIEKIGVNNIPIYVSILDENDSKIYSKVSIEQYVSLNFKDIMRGFSDEPEIVENLSFDEALSDLVRDGCRIVNVKSSVYLDNPHIVSYNEFKSKALERQIVVASPGNSGTFLLVQINKIQCVWIPS